MFLHDNNILSFEFENNIYIVYSVVQLLGNLFKIIVQCVISFFFVS